MKDPLDGTIRDTLAEGTEGAQQLGPERARVYSDLSPEDKDRYNDDIRATNILLQGLPKDIYTLTNHYTDAKDIWDNVKMLLEAVKLNRGLRDSNYDQLYAYLKQHEAHANENKMMLDQFTQHTVDPLALMSNVSHQQYYSQSSTTPPSTYVPPHFADNTPLDSGLSPTDNLIENLTNTLALLTQSYKTYLPQTNNQLRTSSNTRNQATVQDGKVVVQNVQVVAGYGGAQNRVGNANPGQARQIKIKGYTDEESADSCMMIRQLLCMMMCDEQPNEAPTAQTMFMANLSSTDPVYDEARVLSYEIRHYSYQREQKIDEQLRIVITDRNRKEESLKRELHSVKLQLTYTINHNKSMVEEVTSLKKDFKQKENKYLEEFLDMKALKEKAEDKLYKQDQSLQIVHMLCKPKPYYDEPNKAIVYNSEDTLEIAKITRKKMNEKMKDPQCVKKKVKIAPHDYSKENYLATFTPQKQLTPEQIFWSNDLIKMKAEALKEQTTASRPIKALTVYPPNTPATLVPRVLPTKSQVKINIFALIQLFSEFEKTCKKRITPTGLTEGERGFEQTKECYLTEVIPFFKTLKEHFEGIQKALTKEIKEMKDIFKELEAEVDQNVVNRKHDEIERKNILIANDNLIVDCLSKEVFYIATNSELTIIQLTEKVTTLQEQNEFFRAENAKVKQHYKDLYDSIEITHAKHIEHTTALTTKNKNLKAQIHENLKCNTIDSVKPRVLAPGRYAIDVEPIPPNIRNNREVHLDYLKHLKESVETLREIVEKAKIERPLDRSLASACLYTKHSQELLEYAIGTCPKDFNQKDKNHAYTLLNKKKQVTFKADASGSQPMSNTKKNRILPAKSVNKKKVEERPRTNKSSLKITNRVDFSISFKRTHSVNASPSVKNVMRKVKQVWKPTSKILTNVGYQWMPTGRTFTLGEQCPLTRITKSKVVPAKQTENISTSKTVITRKLSHTSQKPLTRYQRKNQPYQAVPGSIPTPPENWAFAYVNQLDPNRCSKHMMGDRSRLKNFVKKFIGIVRFGNDHFGAIMGYGDYVIGDSVISRVYYVEGLGHNLFSVGQFCNSDLEVAFRKHSCYVQDTDGVELIKNGVVEIQNQTLVEATRTMLIFSKAPMFLWAEAVATACYTQNRSLIHTRHNKTPYELVHDRKPDLTFFQVFGALCYPTNDSEDLGKLQPTADIGIFVGYAPSRKGYRIYNKRTRKIMETIHVQFDEMSEPMAHVRLSTGPASTFLTPRQISSGLVPNPVPATPYVPPKNKELEILFQPMFDEYLEPPRVERPVSHALAVSVPVNSTDNPFAPVDYDPFVNVFAPEPSSEASSSGDVSSAESTHVIQPHHHLEK
ncbi:retrovirus-related pol polyprotein from transposon TNT 1-94 [Tanacetum coccineum]